MKNNRQARSKAESLVVCDLAESLFAELLNSTFESGAMNERVSQLIDVHVFTLGVSAVDEPPIGLASPVGCPPTPYYPDDNGDSSSRFTFLDFDYSRLIAL